MRARTIGARRAREGTCAAPLRWDAVVADFGNAAIGTNRTRSLCRRSRERLGACDGSAYSTPSASSLIIRASAGASCAVPKRRRE
jgi:hypothetical protein